MPSQLLWQAYHRQHCNGNKFHAHIHFHLHFHRCPFVLDCQCTLPDGMKQCKNLPAELEIGFIRLYQVHFVCWRLVICASKIPFYPDPMNDVRIKMKTKLVMKTKIKASLSLQNKCIH